MLHFLFLPLREVFFSLPPVDTNILLLDTSLFALKQEDILRCICKYWNLIYWFSKQGCSSSTKQHSEFFNYIIFSFISKPKDEIRRIKSIRKIVTKKVNLMSSIAMFLYIHCVPSGRWQDVCVALCPEMQACAWDMQLASWPRVGLAWQIWALGCPGPSHIICSAGDCGELRVL